MRVLFVRPILPAMIVGNHPVRWCHYCWLMESIFFLEMHLVNLKTGCGPIVVDVKLVL